MGIVNYLNRNYRPGYNSEVLDIAVISLWTKRFKRTKKILKYILVTSLFLANLLIIMKYISNSPSVSTNSTTNAYECENINKIKPLKANMNQSANIKSKSTDLESLIKDSAELKNETCSNCEDMLPGYLSIYNEIILYLFLIQFRTRIRLSPNQTLFDTSRNFTEGYIIIFWNNGWHLYCKNWTQEKAVLICKSINNGDVIHFNLSSLKELNLENEALITIQSVGSLSKVSRPIKTSVTYQISCKIAYLKCF